MIKKPKVVILAGGLGTRLREETEIKPKPMVNIGSMPILWHLMKFYSSFGLNEFIICTGYKGEVIRDFFKNFHLNTLDFTIDLTSAEPVIEYHQKHKENWKVTVVDTGSETPTGGRIHKIRRFIETDYFYCTYGDGLSNVDLNELTRFHLSKNVVATMSTVKPMTRFGVVNIDEQDKVKDFQEKPVANSWINAGFFIFDNRIFEFLDDKAVLEEEPLKELAKTSNLVAFKHEGYWQPMDTHREFLLLNDLWNTGNAPWKNWND